VKVIGFSAQSPILPVEMPQCANFYRFSPSRMADNQPSGVGIYQLHCAISLFLIAERARQSNQKIGVGPGQA
jgi:hypothetical protein